MNHNIGLEILCQQVNGYSLEELNKRIQYSNAKNERFKRYLHEKGYPVAYMDFSNDFPYIEWEEFRKKDDIDYPVPFKIKRFDSYSKENPPDIVFQFPKWMTKENE